MCIQLKLKCLKKIGIDQCKKCKKKVKKGKSICCGKNWYNFECSGLSRLEFDEHAKG